LAGYAQYQIDPRLAAGVRYEGFHDPQGYRTGILAPNGDGQFWREATVTAAYTMTPSITLRGEFRKDVSTQAVFLNADNSTLANTNQTVAAEVLVKF
jgi:hypothetical protein